MSIEEEFEKALQKFERDFAQGKASKADFDRLDVWQQLLQAKGEAEREHDAKDVNNPRRN
jgi:hypothetical protein|tara:strand:- start:2 stop:181 length:180 start_codon:yes stop_codon:yes gene_type:complete